MRDHPHPHLDPEDMGLAHPDAQEEDFMEKAVNLESKSSNGCTAHSQPPPEMQKTPRQLVVHIVLANPRFYDEGYASGHAHGKLHGLFEGRQLGLEKAWEIWEEVGFYEGFAAVVERKLAAGSGSGRKDAKTLLHIKTLKELISQFPTTNPTPAGTEPAVAEADDGPDLAALMSQIRARYRLLCTSVGARPRLVAVSKDGTDGALPSAGVVEGIEGPMKGVDTRQLKF